MYGKIFASMYDGSLFGSGAVVFAAMGYVIATQEPDRDVGSQVRLNPQLLAAVLGEKVEAVEEAIAVLCAPDPKSTTAAEGGRRLMKIGTFDYKVVNGPKYRAIRDEESRREQNRKAQEKFRKKAGGPQATEIQRAKEVDNGERCARCLEVFAKCTCPG
jgi:hypothetical protein